MYENEIDSVRASLQSSPRPTSLTERRERLDLVASADPVAPDIHFRRQMVGTCEAEWSLAPESDTTKTLLYFHGGGYCAGSIRSHRRMVAETGRAARVRTFALAYRLAPENPFPAALDDGLAAFEFLLAQGVPAASIAIGGDSAGGGVTLATMIRLRDAGKPLPGCAWLVSPWVDLEMTGASIDEKAAVDPLIHRDYLEELAGAYLGGASAREPLVSPLHADLAGLPADPDPGWFGRDTTRRCSADRPAAWGGRRGDEPGDLATHDPRVASVGGTADFGANGDHFRWRFHQRSSGDLRIMAEREEYPLL